MLYCEETVKANIRNRQGKRVFFLGSSDTLTPTARDYLARERIEILPAEQAKIEEYVLENGAVFREKPENYTHLRGNILVPKTHPVIAFRGAMDSLQAELLLAQLVCKEQQQALEEILTLARNMIRWDVMEEPVVLDKLCGLTQQQLRQHSHDPQKYYGVPHFMPAVTDGAAILQLNKARTAARAAELAAAHAFADRRQDLLQALNRMSSMLYLLMIHLKQKQ
ncbi:MAG: ATP-binding protein [Oscillospiraceae bacterium]|nr:ATP-binding protein [Oscillospiraceae bacterium]